MLSAPNNHAKEVASMRTRERILETALRLFNEQGTAAVSTNHIAEALEISPGNLYYHFRNKEEIVRALVDRLFARTGSELNLPADRPPTPDDLQDLVRINFAILWDYRFVYRELLALLQRDDALRQLYTTVRARGFADMQVIVGQFVQAGVLIPIEPAVIDELSELCWLVSEFWLTNVEVSGHSVDTAQMERGARLLLRVLQPYLSSR
jgi:AcrR family transcriptional regulator